MMRTAGWLLAAAAVLLAVGPAAAQESADEAPDIVVEARRSGAPMWEVLKGDSTVLLVGEIAEIPKITPWQPDRLAAATRRADRVILELKPTVSPGVIFKAMFKLGALINLPKKTVSSDYLSPDLQARLTALERAYGKSYERRSFMLTARDLLNRRLDFDRNTTTDVTDIVKRTAQQAQIPTRPVGKVKGGDMLNSLLAAPPGDHIPCLAAAMTAVEAGPEIIAQRGDAWTRFDVPAVMASPLEIALGSCWPWTDVKFGPELRGLWIGEIGRSLDQRGVTLAVVPLRVLAEDGGLLDQLKARGLEIEGPAWRDPADEVRSVAAPAGEDRSR